MSADDNSLARPYAERLTDLENRLRSTMDDRSLQQDVYRAIRSLLSDHKDSETDIRKILLGRFESGKLREETFRLVQGMLDRIVTEDLDTLGGPPGGPAAGFGDTDVLPVNVLDTPQAADQLQVGSLLRERFLLQRRVAGGSMGVVYKAMDRRLAETDGGQPWVAIKVLSPQLSRNAGALRALQQEAAKGRCLSHPNIVRVIDLDRDDDTYFIVMEWLEGRSLASILDDPKSEKMDLDTALEVVRQIGSALDYAHRCGVVHADVKPGNIMVTPRGDVKLIDFGVARVLQKQRADGQRNPESAALRAATPAYSSMQVLTGEDPVPADDVFSLGCLFYRLVAGYRVFGPRNAAEAAAAGMQPERPAVLNDGQWKALKKALAYSRVARYGSPKAFLDDLDAARRRGSGRIEPTLSDDDTISAPAPSAPRRSRPLLAAGGLLLAAGALVLLQPERFEPYVARLLDFIPAGPALESTSAVVGSPGPGVPPRSPAGGAQPEVSAGNADPGAASGAGDVGSTAGAVTADGGQATPTTAEPAPADTADGAAPDVSVVGGRVVAGDEGGSEAATTMDGDAPAAASADGAPADADDPVDTQEIHAVEEPKPAPARSFVRLPPPTHELTLAAPGDQPTELAVRLRENGEPAIIDVYRSAGLKSALVAQVTEDDGGVSRTAWESGQYELSNDGMLEFAAGEDVARIRISMVPDPLREPDRELSLIVRDLAEPDVELALIRLTLEDDDQRLFEQRLPPNTVGFAVSQVSVRESDRAVQIDVIRFRPDAKPLEVDYVIRDVTATEGLDYFAPGITTMMFAPNQRTARLLIPLVQDNANESDEAFLVEIPATPVELEGDLFRRIAVMIRDDDP